MSLSTAEIERYRREVEHDPGSMRFVPLAEALRKSGQLAEATEVLERGLGHHPKLRSAQVVQARLWRDLGQGQRALTLLEELYPLDAGNVALAELYCELLIAFDHLEKAAEVLRVAQFTGLPDPVRMRLEATLEAARFPDAVDEADLDDLSSLAGVMTLPGLFLEELGDPFAVPIVAARVGRSGSRTAAKAIWREVARLHPAFATRAGRELARLDGIAGRLPRTGGPSVLPVPADPPAVARALREWAERLGLDV